VEGPEIGRDLEELESREDGRCCQERVPAREIAGAALWTDFVGLAVRSTGSEYGGSLITWSRAGGGSWSIEASSKGGFGRGDGRRSTGGCIDWLKVEFVGELAYGGLLAVVDSLGGDNDRARSVAYVNQSGQIFNCAW
jgi:hypothetical protein